MVTVRKAEDDDALAIFELARIFGASFEVQEQAFFNSFSGLLANPAAFLAVIEDQGAILGYVLGFDHETFFANGRVSWVEEITVREDQRRSGLGSLLMECFEVWARSRESKLIALATRRAAGFYHALGYEESAAYFRKLLG